MNPTKKLLVPLFLICLGIMLFPVGCRLINTSGSDTITPNNPPPVLLTIQGNVDLSQTGGSVRTSEKKASVQNPGSWTAYLTADNLTSAATSALSANGGFAFQITATFLLNAKVEVRKNENPNARVLFYFQESQIGSTTNVIVNEQTTVIGFLFEKAHSANSSVKYSDVYTLIQNSSTLQAKVVALITALGTELANPSTTVDYTSDLAQKTDFQAVITTVVSTVTTTTTGTNTSTGTTTATSTATTTNTGTNTGTNTTTASNTVTTTGTSTSTVTTTATSTVTTTATGTSTVTTTDTATGTSTVVATTTISFLDSSNNATSSFNFGTVLMGSSTKQTITIKNTSPVASITVSGISVSGANFSLATGTTTSFSLNPAGTQAIDCYFTPVATGTLTGTITISHNALTTSPTGSSTLSLTGIGSGAAQLNVASNSQAISSMALDATNVGSSSIQKNFVVTNTGKDTLIFQIQSSGTDVAQFSVVDGSGNAVTLNNNISLGVNGANTYGIIFKPTSFGAKTATVTVISSNVSGTNSYPITLTGSGLGPKMALSLTTIPFSSVAIGSSGTANLDIGNIGNATMSITAVTASTTFTTNFGTLSPPVIVSPGATQTIQVYFTPTARGAITGNLNIVSPLETQIVSLTGTGLGPKIELKQSGNPITNIAFVATKLGITTTVNVDIWNTGDSLLTVSTSTFSAPFATNLAAPASIATNSFQTVQVTFCPTSATSFNSNVNFVSNAAEGSGNLSVSGTGLVAGKFISFTPASLTFRVVAGSYTEQLLYVSNTGADVLTVSNIAITPAVFTLGTNTTSLTIPGGASATYKIRFTPGNTVGTQTGTITYTNDSATTSAIVNLSGCGLATSSAIANMNVSFPAGVAAGNFEVRVSNVPATFTLDNSFTFKVPAVDGSGNPQVAPYMYFTDTGKFQVSDFNAAFWTLNTSISSFTFSSPLPNGMVVTPFNTNNSTTIDNITIQGQ
ncbi:MAG: choice-of-anchor D domain-containing protein [Candidatus Riflebacteria bacterium]|nr:choice-of-anchor D domain-containing protein [Candidatus Riflebacteria bacterium]